MFIFSASVAYGAFTEGFSSVDQGEIRWGGSTKYVTQWNAGVNTWNALKKIKIAPDTIWTYEDLKIRDVYTPNVTYAARYFNWPSFTDKIEFNTALIDNYSTAKKQCVATHEIGHALGLDHSKVNNIMLYRPTEQTYLGSLDKSTYYYLWGN